MSGTLEFVAVNGQTTAKTQSSRYPLRFMLPKKMTDRRADCVWVYMLNYGGGLVAGDAIRVTCSVGPGCTVALATQGSTKVFKAQPGRPACQQSLEAQVAEGALLALVPDPVTCYAEAIHQQSQDFFIDPGGNLVLVDWFTGGRTGRGESWCFTRLESSNRVYVGGKLMMWEPLVLEEGGGAGDVASRMGLWTCCCTLVVVGPKLRPVLDRIRQQQKRGGFEDKVLVGRRGPPPQAGEHHHIIGHKRPLENSGGGDGDPSQGTRRSSVVFSICPLPCEDALLFKAATTTTEEMYHLLHYLLQPTQGLLGRPPYVNHVVVSSSSSSTTTSSQSEAEAPP